MVRITNAMAASSIGQYERSVRALAEYFRNAKLGLRASFRGTGSATSMTEETRKTGSRAIGAGLLCAGLAASTKPAHAGDGMLRCRQSLPQTGADRVISRRIRPERICTAHSTGFEGVEGAAPFINCPVSLHPPLAPAILRRHFR